MRKTIGARLPAAVITVAMAMIMTLMPATAFAAEGGAANGIQLHNPTVVEGVSTWDCIYFGNYKQGETEQPIKWRVLEVKDTDDDGQIDDVFVLADRVLENQPYNTEEIGVTWEICTLRGWLNNDFLNTAFTSEEQNAIRKTSVVNNNNPQYNTEGGNDTEDKVFLLSIEEVSNSSYGFASDTSRIAKYVNSNVSNYWLRSPGSHALLATIVYDYGYVHYNGSFVCNDGNAVRPALHINLQSSTWRYAGTVSSDGTEKSAITEVTLREDSYAYSGSPITPEPVVRCGDIVLNKDTDYTVSYINNVNAGVAVVKISGEGDYIGSCTEYFVIEMASINEATIQLEQTQYIYNGSFCTPAVTVAMNGIPLAEGDDYNVSYRNNKDVGTATVTIKGAGNYRGRVTRTFTITAPAPTPTPTPAPTPKPASTPAPAQPVVRTDINFTVRTKAKNNNVTLKWGTVPGAASYTVYYALGNGKSAYTQAGVTRGNSLTIKNLNRKANYQVFVRANMANNAIANSYVSHVAMPKYNRTNPKSLKLKFTKATLKVGKTKKIKATVVKESKKKKLLGHAAKLRYYSTNTKVATVSKAGRIKAVAKGKANIIVITENGLTKTVKVTVK